ncbi:MAG: hypothetical protein BA863_17730 [Desulfovibrio sp. S3730MH75]|nr:MAG: hypothetical protein BA863_17730 [Desulfovibrio sp. S3730MH75]
MEKALILVVEDSVSIGQQLKVEIEKNSDFKVCVATSYKDAEKIISERGDEVFLAILDLLLPDAPDGEIVDLAMNYDLPSVIFTSDIDDLTRADAFSKNIIDFVVKDRHAIANLDSIISWLQSNLGKKILIVDDSKSICSMVSSRLVACKLNVFTAGNGLEALQIVQENPDLSLIITDFEMPEMDGLALVKKIRTEHSREKLAIIGMSSVDNRALSAKFLKYGANDFIRKPFEPEELVSRVRTNLENLEHLQKLRHLSELKNTVLGTIAHDLRSPIGGIIGVSELLCSELKDELDAEYYEMLSLIREASGDMNVLVNDLLDISAIERGKLSLVKAEHDLGRLIMKRLKIHRFSGQKKGISLETEFASVPLVTVDGSRISQVVDNFVTNAVKFSTVGTKVLIRLMVEEGKVVVSVIDQGPGIPEGEEEKLFKSFQKTSVFPTAGEKSTGLGLAIAKKIVESHNGNIWVENNHDKGAAFNFSVPLR